MKRSNCHFFQVCDKNPTMSLLCVARYSRSFNRYSALQALSSSLTRLHGGLAYSLNTVYEFHDENLK